VTDFEDLSEIRDAVKAKFDPVMADVGAALIQFYNRQYQFISTWALFNSLPQEYFTIGGSCVFIEILPLPLRRSTQIGEDYLLR